MAKASDCGSEDRGFESHHPPQKKRGYLTVSSLFLDNGTRKAGTSAHTGAKTVRWTVLGRGRVPALSDASGTDVDESATVGITTKFS